MKNFSFKITLLVFIASLVVSSCSRDNSVVSNSRIQKRKYNSGFHIDKNKKFRTVNDKKQIDRLEIAVIDNEKSNENITLTENLEIVDNSVTSVVQNETSNSNEVATSQDQIEVSQETSVKGNAIPHVEENKKSSSMNPFFQDKKVKGKKSNETIIRSVVQQTKEKKAEKKSMRIDSIIYIILCIFLPVIAVGLATNWDVLKTVIALLLMFLFWIPGIIYAFYICDQEGVL